MSVTGTFQGQILGNDSTVAPGTPQVPKAVNGQYTGTVTEFANALVVGTSPVSLGLLASPAQFVYIKNISTSTQTITVTWTPNGGSTATILVLQPLGFIFFVEPDAVKGISALTVTSSASAGSIEYYIVG
jgi:hypothetical protein